MSTWAAEAGLGTVCVRQLSTGSGFLADLAAVMCAWQADMAASPHAGRGNEREATKEGPAHAIGGGCDVVQHGSVPAEAQAAEQRRAGTFTGVVLAIDALHLPDSAFRVARLLQAALVLRADTVAYTDRLPELARAAPVAPLTLQPGDDGSGFLTVAAVGSQGSPAATGLGEAAHELLPFVALQPGSLAAAAAAAGAGGNLAGFLDGLAARVGLRAAHVDCCLYVGDAARRAFAGAVLRHLVGAATNPAARLGDAAARARSLRAGLVAGGAHAGGGAEQDLPGSEGGFARCELVEFAAQYGGLAGAASGRAPARPLPACLADAGLWRQAAKRGHQVRGFLVQYTSK